MAHFATADRLAPLAQTVKRLPITLLFLCLSLLPVPTSATTRQPPDRYAESVLAEINLARSQPLAYAAHLRRLRETYEGTRYRSAGSPVYVQTREGVAAVDEAILFLLGQKPLPHLAWSPGLAVAAAELTRRQTRSGAMGHGTGSGDMRRRIERRGRWEGGIAENIAYGLRDPRDMVMQLIIDDGVPGRGHRTTIFSPAFRTVGIACASHPRSGTVCVMDFAGGFWE